MDRQEIVRKIQTNLIGIPDLFHPQGVCRPKVERYRPQDSTAGGLVRCMQFGKIRDTKLTPIVRNPEICWAFCPPPHDHGSMAGCDGKRTAAFQEGGSTQNLPLLRRGFILVALLVSGVP
jgi:hypothetical protein